LISNDIHNKPDFPFGREEATVKGVIFMVTATVALKVFSQEGIFEDDVSLWFPPGREMLPS
jgi:hypothetical protein